MNDEDGIDVDPLAVGLTRPSTVLGVPYGAAILNLLISVEALSLTENLFWLLMCIPVHGICYLITLKDPRTFELLAMWARTTLGTLIASRWYWSASSYSPLTFRARPGYFQRWLIKRRLKRENRI
jgi:type IV secretion system protein VirB3